MKLLEHWRKFAIAAGILLGVSLPASLAGPEPQGQPAAYDTAMIDLIADIRSYARDRQPNFELLGNGGAALLCAVDGNTEDNAARQLKNLDGQMVESAFYGWNMQMGGPTPKESQNWLSYLLQVPQAQHLPIFSLNYVKDDAMANASYQQADAHGYIGLASPRRELDQIPAAAPHHINRRDIHKLQEAENYLVLLNPGRFASKEDYLQKLAATDYDLLIIDLVAWDEPLSAEDVQRLQTKANGAKRLVFAYLSLGEAAAYRDYWQKQWDKDKPDWLEAANPDWPGSYKVQYWRPEWRAILYGSPKAQLDQILAAGFDGAFLDTIDTYAYFQQKESKR